MMVRSDRKRGDNISQPWWIKAGVEEGIEKEKEIARSLFAHVQEPGGASFSILCCQLKQEPVNPGHVKPKGFCVVAELIFDFGFP